VLEEDLKYIKDVMQSANINFLIGSGLSRPYLKTLGNIENYLTELSDKEGLDDSILLMVKNSIFYHYFIGAMFGNRSVIKNAKKSDLLLTAKNYSEFLQTFNALLQLRGSTILNKQVNIFTTNIDLFIEKGLEDLGLEFNDGFSGRLSPTFNLSNYNKVLSKKSLHFDNESRIPVFNLLKMHGSLNWKFGKNNEIEYTNDLSYLAETKILSKECDFIEIEETDTIDILIEKAKDQELLIGIKSVDIVAFQKQYEEIPIVNPTKAKFKETVLDLNYYELLRYYSNELEKENSVLFVMGFSMADEHIAQITLRLAKSNPTLTIIIFAFDETSRIQIRHNLHNADHRNIKFYIPEDPAVFDFATINNSIFKPILKMIEDE
jgi:hypothetical protein